MRKKQVKRKKKKLIDNTLKTTPIGNNKRHTLNELKNLFGLDITSTDMVDTIDTLRKNKPNIIIGTCTNNFMFRQNNGPIQKLQKKENYVMSLSVYANLEFDRYKTNPKTGLGVRNLKPAKIKFYDIYRPYEGQDLSNKTLLVMRTGGIGDLLFIQPNLIYLKNKYPTCKIVFASSAPYHPMLENWDCIDKVISLPFGAKILYQSNYHLIFEGVIERTKEAHHINAYELFSKWMCLNLSKDLLRPIQPVRIDRYTEISQVLKNKFNIDDSSDKICTVQLKASSPIRTPHPEQLWLPILKFILSRGYKIVIVDNPALHEQIENIINTYFGDIKDSLVNFVKYSKDISYAIALASMSEIVIGPDSSMVHIAESVGTKSFGIYGPFPGSIRLSTYKYNSWIDCKADCSPCFTHGHRPCIYGGQNGGCSPCYQNINMSEFIKKFKELEIRNV